MTARTPAQEAQIRYIRTLLTVYKMDVQQLRDLGYAEAAIKAAQEDKR